MSEANIVIKATDQFSARINSMANANKGFSKAMEEVSRKAQTMAQRYDALTKNNAKLKSSLDGVSKELKDAKKRFQETGDAADGEALQAAYEKYDNLKGAIADTTAELKDCTKAMRDLEAENRRGGGGGGSGGGGSGGLAQKLGQSGLASAVGDWAADLAGTFVQSAGGDAAASMFGSVLGMAGTGAAVGSMFGPIGTAVGAVVGAAAGAVTGIAKNFEKKDEYYKNAVQEDYEGFKQATEERISTGSVVASGREIDELSFNKLLGEGTGTEYLKDLRDLAAHTPLEYDQLTEISRQLAIGFGDESDRMLDLIEVVGDAGSAVGLDASGMVTIATALSRMQSSDKVTLEYLNLIQERGIDAIGLIGQAKGFTTAQVYDAISKGSLDGSDIVTILQEGMAGKYGGSMQEQSQTYTGMSSTLADQKTERDNLTGESYNKTRAPAMEMEIAFNDSEVGQRISEIYAYKGELAATAENLRNNYTNRAQEFLLTGQGSIAGWNPDIVAELNAYRAEFVELENTISTSADPVEVSAAKARMADLLDIVTSLGENQFETSDFVQGLNEIDQYFIDGLQSAQALGDNTTGYAIGQELGKGIANGLNDHAAVISGAIATAVRTGIQIALPNQGGTTEPYSSQNGSNRRRAFGLDRVPYNGYYAMLHEGERVLTAQQARQMDAAGGLAGGVVITGNSFTVREDADISRIASEFVRQLRAAQLNYARA